jgi:hypothetical protein
MRNTPDHGHKAGGTVERVALGIALLVMFSALPAHATRRSPGQTIPKLQNSAPSLDAPIIRFLDALRAKDRHALQRLRVNKREYIDIIMPGTVPPGKERRTFPGDRATYFWDVLNEKSVYSELALLHIYGGRKYTVRQVEWAKGVQEFEGYKD